MLTKAQADLMLSMEMDLGPTIYGSLMGGATPAEMVAACGEALAGPQITRWIAENKERAALVAKAERIRTTVVHPPEKIAANAIMVALWKAGKQAYKGETYDLVTEMERIKRLAFALDHVPIDLVALFTSVKDSKGKIKGSVSTRTGEKYGGKAINISIRFDALQASRAKKTPATATKKTISPDPDLSELAVPPELEVRPSRRIPTRKNVDSEE